MWRERRIERRRRLVHSRATGRSSSYAAVGDADRQSRKVDREDNPVVADPPAESRLPFELDVWMSHGDHVTLLPDGFTTTATTGDVITAIESKERGIYCVQFHPEV